MSNWELFLAAIDNHLLAFLFVMVIVAGIFTSITKVFNRKKKKS